MSENTNPVDETFTVSRRQGLSYDHYAELKKITNGRLVSFNTFLSVNIDCEMAINSTKRAIRDGFETSVVFSIAIEASTTASISFTRIGDLSYFDKPENKYIFSINTIFRIKELEKLTGESGVLHVKLQPISARDKLIQQLMQLTRRKIEGSTNMLELAKLMILMNQYSMVEIIQTSILDDKKPNDFIKIESSIIS